MKIFATTKIWQAKRALPATAGETFFKFSIAISLNCVGKMLIWGHFCGIMEMLLNNYLGHFLIIGKTFVFLFIESAIKPTPLLHAKLQIPWRTECNRSNWRRPECSHEPEPPVTTQPNFIIVIISYLFLYLSVKNIFTININIIRFSNNKTWKPQWRAGSIKTEIHLGYILMKREISLNI